MPEQTDTEQKNTDAPSLSDLSSRDKPWDKHRSNADKVSAYYVGSEFQGYSDRAYFCSELLDFRLTPDQDEGVYKLKLAAARFCRVRHCPVCQWRRSLMWKAKAYKILPRIIKKYPTHRWLFLTLTLRNCKITELRETLKHMHESFKRMTKLKAFPAIGWIKSTEVTRGKDGSAHPHFHCLLMVAPGYFGKNYIRQDEWVEMWRQSLRIDYNPVLDVQAIKKGQSPASLVPELLKYCTKESDLVADREWFLELTRQMHKTRAIATGGVLKEYLKELEQEPSDLVGEDSQAEVDEGHLYFDWKRKEKKYRLVE
ncbi:replication protein (plasmid) [Crinalium epipsammum PCC 9333]|uniref:Replication protein n=1 Tax=Crinalium epipsammum PCC 9333 TaxID=1173022 RepID=K9W8E8_9CYAN|nr:protein rep [Crinalium epipsammum]AFZ15760.1 replication protein [Crinalium epipsammum PCC 9333]